MEKVIHTLPMNPPSLRDPTSHESYAPWFSTTSYYFRGNLAPVKPWESARGLAQSKTLARCPGALDHALASWSAPVLWRFALRLRGFMRELFREILTPALSPLRGEEEERLPLRLAERSSL